MHYFLQTTLQEEEKISVGTHTQSRLFKKLLFITSQNSTGYVNKVSSIK